MTYLDYIVFFEKLDQRQAFSGNATRLYLKLLALANAIGWPAEFAKPDPYIAAVCSFSINTMKDCRAQLVAGGLLSITSGGTGRSAATTYQLLKPSKFDALPVLNPSNFAGLRALKPSKSDGFKAENPLNPSENPSNFDTLYIDKENNNTSAASAAEVGISFSDAASTEQQAAKTSRSKKSKKNGASLADVAALSLPHTDPEFAESWRIFYTENTKQAGKPLTAFELMLKKLGKYPAGFAVVMLDAAIQGNWSGVENAGTARAFAEWQNEQARQTTHRPLPMPLPTVGPAPTTAPDLNPEVVAQRQAQRETEAAEARRRVRAGSLAS
ncbi:hypothetical protein GCM10023172_27540 [Hymenobacter ginsengisoli]|uniref:DnaD domain-containing protein n=1 Tax=Hymenobacter ginsengisoli TaxID=1051626 RepID=A0ABP8QIE5_9BACT|nr:MULTISPECIES: hypothetical protein [unclassified Hymenobacter]MBO2029991.1 hypothetical protein [Hymenobacter sp. BT559]